MDGNAKAADAAEQAQGVLAEMRRGVERYVRLRLASTVLRQEIERYRAEKQEMLLRRASELFAQITLGSFSELEVGFSEKDEPVLVGVRPSGEQVGVVGMSDGTRDQLYLCLRLAHRERRLVANEPTPFIVDDILIQFDDKRAEATLKALADLSTKTQVIFFTHHSRLVELANAIVDSDIMQVHSLNPEPVPTIPVRYQAPGVQAS